MMKFLPLSAAILGLACAPARAHVGHIGEAAGHHHWGGIILLGAAVGVGLWAALKGKKDDAKPDTEKAEKTLATKN